MALLSLLIGSGGLLWKMDAGLAQLLLLEYRLPSTIMAVLAGGTLALSGLFMQNVFRNPLAGPFVLGISSGASLGIALVILAGSAMPFALGAIPFKAIAAIAGALLMLLLNVVVYARLRNTVALLIFGMLAAHFVSALVESLQYMASGTEIRNFFLWGMGNLQVSGWAPHLVIAAILIPAWMTGIRMHGAMDVYQLGDEYARSLGLNINRYRKTLMYFTALMAGCVTAWCGPLSFVGLVVPHVARLVLGSALHRHLVTATILLGSLFMLAAHLLSMVPVAGSQLPVNVICSILGAPMVMFLILRNRNLLLE
ncbi:MAG: iron ABC transporter permease [Bacteroidetes bacterium]|nr:iron ABC transporter permease [Bacteroidota bacterium]